MARRNSARPDASPADDWFAPKRYGFGSGPPIAWQGWLVCIVYGVVVTLAALLLAPRSVPAFIAVVTIATAVLLFICAKKTRGGWRWRWGDDA